MMEQHIIHEANILTTLQFERSEPAQVDMIKGVEAFKVRRGQLPAGNYARRVGKCVSRQTQVLTLARPVYRDLDAWYPHPVAILAILWKICRHYVLVNVEFKIRPLPVPKETRL